MAETQADDRLNDAVDKTRGLWERRRGRAAASDGVYETLAEAIGRKYLPEGFRLAEEELARWFGVSRTPVREALVRLEADHLAERVARRGLVVAHITAAEILEVYVVREIMDGLAAREAARRASAAERAQLAWLNERLKGAAEAREFDRMAELNLEFHEELARSAHNSLLLSIVRSVHSRVQRFPGTTFTVGDRALEAVSEHAAILQAIQAGDSDLAEVTARQHMANATLIRIDMLASASVDHLERPKVETIR